MNRKEKEEFVNSFMDSMKADLLSRLDRVPEGWDGLELREWIAGKFEHEKWGGSSTFNKRGKRYKAFVSAVYYYSL